MKGLVKKMVVLLSMGIVLIRAFEPPLPCPKEVKKEDWQVMQELAEQFIIEIPLDVVLEEILGSYMNYKPIGLAYLSTQTIKELIPYIERIDSKAAVSYQEYYNKGLEERSKRGLNVIMDFFLRITQQLKLELQKRVKSGENDFQRIILQKPINLNGLTFKELQDMLGAVERILNNQTEQKRWAVELHMDDGAFVALVQKLKKLLTVDITQVNKRVEEALTQLEQEKEKELARSTEVKEALKGEHAQESMQKVEEIKKQFPDFFNNIPAELQLRFLNEFETIFGKGRKITDVLADLYPKNLAKAKMQRLIALGNALGYKSYDGGAGYIFFDNGERARGVILPKYIRVQRQFAREIEFEKVEELEKESRELISEVVKTYKIHLMPIDSLDEIIILLHMHDAITLDKDLSKRLKTFKIIVDPYRQTDRVTGQPIIFAKVVLYASGKEDAQNILNSIYKKFKNIAGLDIPPRFNAKVTDLIFIAQGDGDYKVEPFIGYYEQPKRVYYRSDITGKLENYHLIHPGTGKEII